MAKINVTLDKKAKDTVAKTANISGGGTTEYTAGTGIEITENNVINNTQDAVIANPTLVGDEPNLTGLQVGENKYSVKTGGRIAFVNLSFSPNNSSQSYSFTSQEELGKALFDESNANVDVVRIIASAAIHGNDAVAIELYLARDYNSSNNYPVWVSPVVPYKGGKRVYTLATTLIQNLGDFYGYSLTLSYEVQGSSGSHDVVIYTYYDGYQVEFTTRVVDAGLSTYEEFANYLQKMHLSSWYSAWLTGTGVHSEDSAGVVGIRYDSYDSDIKVLVLDGYGTTHPESIDANGFSIAYLN